MQSKAEDGASFLCINVPSERLMAGRFLDYNLNVQDKVSRFYE